MYPRLFQFGSLAIPTAGACAALAILAALFVARTTARRLSLDPERVWDLGIAGVLTALVASRLVLVLTNWQDFIAHPLWMLGLLSIRSPTAQLGGAACAIAVMAVYARFARLPFRSTLDALAPALALASAIVCFGKFVAGSGFGAPTSLPWAVVYTRRLASLWYGTPLGVSLHPVQLYQAGAELLLFALAGAAIVRAKDWKLRPGEVMGTWLLLHGVSVVVLDFFRGSLSTANIALASSLAATMAVAGGLLWLL